MFQRGSRADMRILVASKFWYARGGLERVMLDEVDALRAGGHEVASFATAHPDNLPTDWDEYYAEYIELGSQGGLGVVEKARAAGRLFYNSQSRNSIERILDSFGPDVMHVHGIHRQLSPSILFAAAKRRIPVVQTVHDYHHICPADVMLRGGETPCVPRACGERWFGQCIKNRCVRGSVAASSLSAAETMYQRLLRTYQRTVALMVYPSAYMRDEMLQAG
jgi:hypothetical protein